MGYGEFAAALKPVFLEMALAEVARDGAKLTDSALSLLSGLHRKDVRALAPVLKGTADPSAALGKPSPASQVATRWLTNGWPETLPVAGPAPSFEALARSVSTDLHPRSVLQELLAATGARAQHIRLELTEGAVMRDPATVIDRMREVHAMGFEWSIDDFGTGQSSLAYLNLLPVSELKIDRSFVRGATASRASLTLLKAAIDQGFRYVAQGNGSGAAAAILCSEAFAARHGLDRSVRIRAQAMTTDAPITWMKPRRSAISL